MKKILLAVCFVASFAVAGFAMPPVENNAVYAKAYAEASKEVDTCRANWNKAKPADKARTMKALHAAIDSRIALRAQHMAKPKPVVKAPAKATLKPVVNKPALKVPSVKAPKKK